MNIKLIKAIKLLDLNKVELAEEILLDLSNSTDIDINTLVISHCILGELYFHQKEILNAKKYMEFVINTNIDNDTLDYEKSVALDILEKIKIFPADDVCF